MLIAIVLDRPLQEAQELVDQPHLFLQEIRQVLDDQKSHPILERMLRTIQGDTAKQEATSSMERPSHTDYMGDTQYQQKEATRGCPWMAPRLPTTLLMNIYEHLA